MTLHYLNKVPRAARRGRAKRKLQNKKEARLLALFGEQTAMGCRRLRLIPEAGVGRLEVAAFWGIQWKLVRSWLAREGLLRV